MTDKQKKRSERFERNVRAQTSDPALIAKKLKDHRKLIYKDNKALEQLGSKVRK